MERRSRAPISITAVNARADGGKFSHRYIRRRLQENIWRCITSLGGQEVPRVLGYCVADVRGGVEACWTY